MIEHMYYLIELKSCSTFNHQSSIQLTFASLCFHARSLSSILYKQQILTFLKHHLNRGTRIQIPATTLSHFFNDLVISSKTLKTLPFSQTNNLKVKNDYNFNLLNANRRNEAHFSAIPRSYV